LVLDCQPEKEAQDTYVNTLGFEATAPGARQLEARWKLIALYVYIHTDVGWY
jgi:hypothetical protein